MAATPPFLFQISRIEENPDFPVRRRAPVPWLPPRRKYGSQIRGSKGKIYYFNGQRAVESALPSDAVHYRSVSMYHHGDLLYMVPFDATEHQVANGRHDDEDPDTDSDDDAEGEYDDEPHEITMDWGILYFMWLQEGYVSQCVFGGNQRRLSTQRPDQRWVADILPTRHHAEHARRTPDIRYGGMIGDLGIILCLLALSVRHSHVDETIEHCVRGLSETDGGWRRPRRPHPRADKRGVLVKVWSWPPYSTDATLNDIENGQFGKIYH